MTEKYFAKFPTIYYSDQLSRDITRRLSIEPRDKNNPFNFYPFQLRDELRPDQVSDFYYGDPEMDWIIYHMNDIIDPYYQWYNNNDTFETYIKQKYGSIESAQEKIVFYRNNWATESETQISTTHYNQVLPNAWKKYYIPEWGPKAEILSYKRKPWDIIQRTNRMLRYNVSFVSGNSFTIGEVIDLKYDGNIVGGGEVEYANSSTVTIKHVSGNTVANSSIVINVMGETSGSNATSNAVSTVYEAIPLDEEVFWSPVSYFDYENEKNEERKHINLVDAGIASLVVQQFETKLQE